MASDDRRFTYRALANNHIRLIKLLPRKWDEAISIEIDQVADLEDIRAFEAVSYVWGPQEPSSQVTCGEAIFDVGPNLYDALQHMRSENSERWLWIDRITINQQDLDERASQVKLMTRIYVSASRVLVWLGLEDDMVRKGWGILTGILDQYLKITHERQL